MKKQDKKTGDQSEPMKELVKVILHNDDRTSMEFVVFILEAIFDKPADQAAEIMMQVHNEGQSVAGAYPPQAAGAKVAAVKMLAKTRGYPLCCTIEGQEDRSKIDKSKLHRLPAGWIMAGSEPGDYQVSIDTTVSHSGTRCVLMQHAVPSPGGFGTVMQQMIPADNLGKRLRMKMWVKTEDVTGQVQPWMRVDGVSRGKMLGFDNTCNRPFTGTTDWTECAMVLDVPDSATNIAFGIMLIGRGKVWMDDVSFGQVGQDIATTDCPCHARKKATNLSFEEE